MLVTIINRVPIVVIKLFERCLAAKRWRKKQLQGFRKLNSVNSVKSTKGAHRWVTYQL